MKKRSKKPVAPIVKTEPTKQAEAPAPTVEESLEELPVEKITAKEQAAEAVKEEAAVETEATASETAEEAPAAPKAEPEESEDEEPEESKEPTEPKPTDDICGPPGKLCTCARSVNSLPRVPTAILVERHGNRLRRHEEELEDLREANEVILDKLLSLKNQIAVSYGLSLVLAIVVCVLTLAK